MIDDAVCVFCGEPAGRPVHSPNWLCYACSRWQFTGVCPTCGHEVGRDQWEARGYAWPPRPGWEKAT